MAEIKEFIVNDRRKFTADGDIRPDAPPAEPRPARPEASLEPTSDEVMGSSAHLITPAPGPVAVPETTSTLLADDELQQAGGVQDEAPAAPTAEQAHQANVAYAATVDRLDSAIRAGNPGMARMPEMSFARVIQSLYIEALMHLGGVTQPDQQPRVDLLSARQTIDMLAVLAEKTANNLSDDEDKLLRSALFELRMGFLELTQALARQAQAAAQQNQQPVPVGGPSLIR